MRCNLLSAVVLLLLCEGQNASAISKGTINAMRPKCSPGAICFSGEIMAGKEFRKTLNEDMDFVLSPQNAEFVGLPQTDSGWNIEVVPSHMENGCDENSEFAYLVTPPYRYHSELNIDMSYGTSAEEEVENSPRDFAFVMNCAEYKVESERLAIILWPGRSSKREVDEAYSKRRAPVGTGLLWITDSKVSHESDTADYKVGTIKWMKFTVEIKLPKKPNLGQKSEAR